MVPLDIRCCTIFHTKKQGAHNFENDPNPKTAAASATITFFFPRLKTELLPGLGFADCT